PRRREAPGGILRAAVAGVASRWSQERRMAAGADLPGPGMAGGAPRVYRRFTTHRGGEPGAGRRGDRVAPGREPGATGLGWRAGEGRSWGDARGAWAPESGRRRPFWSPRSC